MIATLRDVLKQVQVAAGDAFTGTGLLVCDVPDALPILSLRPLSAPPSGMDLVAALAAISVRDSEYHDGFHIVSSDWRLIRISQYFSPPIVANTMIDRTKLIGGRYVAALLGSAIHGVQLAGIASREFGIAVFKNGSERLFEAAP
jgi:hypothetical protein